MIPKVIKSRQLPAAILTLGLLAILCVLSLASVTIISPLLSLAALIYYAALCLLIIRFWPAAFILILWFVFIRATTMISGVAIESGGAMPEIGQMGEPTGAFVRLAVLYTVGLLALCWLLDRGTKLFKPVRREDLLHKSEEGAWWIYTLFAAFTAILLFALAIGLKNGFPLLIGMDRMLYWTTLDNRFLFFFLGNRAIIALFLGLITAITIGRTRAVALVQIAALFIISFLFAEKFTSIAIMSFAFITPIFLLNESYQKTLLSRLIPIGAGLTALTIPVILIVYGAFDNPTVALERFQERATSQAQLWYVADQNADEFFTFDTPRIEHNLKAIISPNPEALSDAPPYHGAKDFMAETMTSDRYAHYKTRGVTLTMAMEAYLLKLFGWFGMIPVYLLLLAIHAAYLLYLYFGIITVNPLRLVLASKLLVWSNYGLNQGYIWSVFGLKPMLLIAFIIILEFTLRMMLTRVPTMRRAA